MIHRILIASLIVLLAIPVFAADQETKKTTLSGKVTDSNGKPVEGADVQAYSMNYEEQGLGITMTLIGSITTKQDGVFSFTSGSQGGAREIVMVIAHKEGHSLGWSNHDSAAGKTAQLDIQLLAPQKLAGLVTDEEGKPVPNAEVRAMFIKGLSAGQPAVLYSMAPCERGVAMTNEQGQFSFDDAREDAGAEFTIQAKGYGRITTFVPTTRPGQFKAGQSDIEIALSKEAIVQGKIVDLKTRKPIPDAQLVLVPERDNPLMRHVVTSDPDGNFRVDEVSAGGYILKLVAAKDESSGYVSESVRLNVEAGELKDNVVIGASQGLVLELVVLEEGTKAPIANARIFLQNPPESGDQVHMQTDEKGIARFSLAAGEYKITYVYHEEYATKHVSETITLAEGKPASVTIMLKPNMKIRGTVLDPSGNPVGGAYIRLLPMQGDQGITDEAGKFEVPWRPQPWMAEQGTIPLILIRHSERNLAAAMNIEDSSKPINLTLKPAVSIAGKVVDPEGKPLPKAQVRVYTRLGDMSTSIGRDGDMSDEEGKYEVNAIPLDRTYSIHVNADGYGTAQCEVNAIGVAGARIEAEPVTLPLANLTLSGKVVDMEGKPVANARVYAYGSGQPHQETITDKDGKFSLKGVCKGELRVQGSIRGAGTQSYGSISAQGGDTNVVIVLGERATATPARPTPPVSLVDKALPQVTGFGGDAANAALEGKRVLVCFWDMNQRPSRHALRVLASKVDLLEKEGVTVLVIHADSTDMAKLKEWTEQYKVPFAVGMIAKNPEVTQKAWGVQGLPWLILTDKEHKVVKEGCTAEEIEKILAQGLLDSAP